MQLVKYEAARQALQVAKSVDEVKDIRDKAEAMRAYAKQAKDFDMANWAAEIRIRAERRLGEMLKAQKESGGMHKGGNPNLSIDTTGCITLAEMDISRDLSSRAQAIAEVPEIEFENVIAEHRDQQKELTSATIHKLTERGKTHVSHNSGENEWYTPKEYIESALEVMGEIDLDPASCELANKTVGAKKYYTAQDNGLTKEWHGNIWLNPPYAQPLISEFSEKVCSSLHDIDQLIVLVNNATDTNWFQRMAVNASAICFVSKRIKFIDKYGNPSGAPLQGQAILYFGDKIELFKNEFSKYGFVVRHV